MPKIYLSPSTQESNPYVTGSGSEEYNMNLLADALEPYLLSNGIQWVRNTPQMTAASSIRQANELGGFDFYLALHSNASGAGSEGANRGIIVFYYPTSSRGQEAAELFAENLRAVYPLPDRVYTRSTTSLGEVRQPRYPANLIELGYHDNYADAIWIEENRDASAQAIARALTEYFGIPFIYPQAVREGRVATGGSALRLRDYPGQQGSVLTLLPNGAEIMVYGEWDGWYVVHYGELVGYASAAYIDLV
ncbi:MAG: N-acetylmuramoyl-L-alanine amidase [Oscillospiraceae bacterium]|nr:N-acetylmuramoyl-L-alanine amidase [Oscillospiraceae bacterium]